MNALFSENSQYRKTFWFSFKVLASVFVFALFSGILVASLFPKLALEIFQQVAQSFSGFQDLQEVELFWEIAVNNIQIGFWMLVFGVFFGLVPSFIVFTNGFVIGLVAFVFYQQEGFLVTTTGLVPHGVIELPAFILAGALGLTLGVLLFRKLFLKKKVALRKAFQSAFLMFLAIVFPMFVVAAAIESFGTSRLLSLL